jgi:hypothetical protein
MAAVVSSLQVIIRMIRQTLSQLDDLLKAKATQNFMALIREYFSDFQTEHTSGNA